MRLEVRLMNKKILIVAVGVILAGGLLYFARNAKQPPKQQTQGLIKSNTAPPIDAICVANIQNFSHQAVNMEGVDDELVAQLQTVGFKGSRKNADAGKTCDATVNAEVADITGRGRKTARIDYRLTLAGEETPRISASVEGKSAENPGKFASNLRPMALVAAQKPDKITVERDAVSAAIEQQAHHIKNAYDQGLPPWLKKSE